MNKTIEAIYANGVLRPVEPITGVAENGRVMVTITGPARARPLDGWVGGLSDEDAKEMLRVIEAEFEQVNLDEWK